MLDNLLIKHGFEKCLSATPTKRSQKMHWLDDHKNHVHQLTYTHFHTIIIDGSIAAGLSRYSNVWETFFRESLNLSIGGDRTQHIIWRVERLPVPSHLKLIIIIIVPQINQLLKIFTSTYDFIDVLKPTKDWLKCNGGFNNKLFWTDHLHL